MIVDITFHFIATIAAFLTHHLILLILGPHTDQVFLELSNFPDFLPVLSDEFGLLSPQHPIVLDHHVDIAPPVLLVLGQCSYFLFELVILEHVLLLRLFDGIAEMLDLGVAEHIVVSLMLVDVV